MQGYSFFLESRFDFQQCKIEAMDKKLFSLGLVLFFNPWIWRIFSFNFFLGILVVLCAIFLYFRTTHPRGVGNFHLGGVFICFLVLLLFFQWKTTETTSLTNLTNSDIMVRDMRLNEYPPVKVSLANKTLWIPIAHWFEGRQESIAFFRMSKNFSEVVDPNLYFFANHPRERIGISEFEKFPYLLLPFFAYGLVTIISRQKFNKNLKISFFVPILLLTLIGSKNSLGSFSFFPFIIVVSVFGLNQILKVVFNKYKNYKKQISWGFLVLYFLVLIQQISYGIG